MIVFELSMPNKGSWNGKWSQEGQLFVRTHRECDVPKEYWNKPDIAKALEELPSAQPETFEWCQDCKEYDQENYCCHRWSQQIRKTVAELEADYPQALKDELEYWKKRAEEAEADYIRVTGIRKYVPNIDLEEVEEDETD